MIEVEIRAKLNEPQKLVDELRKRGAESLGILKQNDYMYAFENPGEPIKEGGILARIREENDKIRLEFKEIMRESGAGIDIKVEISNVELAKRLISKLGLNYLSDIKKKRELFSLDGFEIAIDNVERLGTFVEVEKTLDSENEMEKTKADCIELLKMLIGEVEIEKRKYGDLLLELDKK
jgi:adenylate cyclase class 2